MEMPNEILGTSVWVGSFLQMGNGRAVLKKAPIFQFKRTG
jgi:hypothetical protein